jgi:glycopeptide antibiotics resistance protein
VTGNRTTVAVLLVIYLALLGTLTFRPAGSAETQPELRINVRPFATIAPALRAGPRSFSFRVMVGNVLAFIPLGLLVPLARPRYGVALALLVGLALSAAIELGQLAVSLAVGFGYRSTDVDDIILNVLGTTIGALTIGAVALVHRQQRTDSR